jgi:hypothetical protein
MSNGRHPLAHLMTTSTHPLHFVPVKLEYWRVPYGRRLERRMLEHIENMLAFGLQPVQWKVIAT